MNKTKEILVESYISDIDINKNSDTSDNIFEFYTIIEELIHNETVKKMQNFKQHYSTNCFDHCLNVSYYSYKVCKKLGLDYVSAARAGMLHDLFLYNWREKSDINRRLHGYRHPKISYNNAKKLFKINDKEKDIILKHMWPLTFSFPKYKESYIVSSADKYCALKESLNAYKHFPKLQKAFRYIYIFLCMLVIKVI